MRQIGTFSIGKAADVVGVKTHTIRYWVDNFEHIRIKIGKGDRRYFDQGAIEELKKIKTMIEVYKMSIDGIKKLISYNKINIGKLQTEKQENEKDYGKFLLKIKEQLKEIQKQISFICQN